VELEEIEERRAKLHYYSSIGEELEKILKKDHLRYVQLCNHVMYEELDILSQQEYFSGKNHELEKKLEKLKLPFPNRQGLYLELGRIKQEREQDELAHYNSLTNQGFSEEDALKVSLEPRGFIFQFYDELASAYNIF